MSKIAEYKQVISEQTFFAYACQIMESLYHSDGKDSISACGQECPHAMRRKTLHQLGANPMQIQNAMNRLSPPPLPPLQAGPGVGQVQAYLMGAADGMQNNVQPYNEAMLSHITPDSMQQHPSMYQQQQGNMQPYQSDLNSFEPLPYNAQLAPPGGGQFDPLPYNAAPNSYDPNALAPTEMSAMMGESLQYQSENTGIQKPGLMYDRGMSGGTVFSLRKFCSEDFEMSSDEGRELMEQLNQEVDQLIRRKSHGLIQIDTKEAFEDLVFEEDSMMFDDDLKDTSPLKIEAPATDNKTTQSRMASGMSFKDDMSLMNMSILTLDEREEKSEVTNGTRSNEHGPKDGADTPKSILTDRSAPRDMRKRGTRVSFAGRNKNISLMSMDDKSFSKLVDSISDPEEGVANEERNMSGLSTDSERSISRKMGFPMRKSVAKKYEEGPPTEVGGKEVGDKVSTLTVSEAEDTPAKNESQFSKLAAEVANPGSEVSNSLQMDGVSLSNLANISALNMSNMSLASDIDPELLK